MSHSLRLAATLLGVAVLTACARHVKPQVNPGDIEPEVVSQGGATIITASVLQEQSRSLLDIMRARIPAMQVVNTQPCPEIYLRGRSTIMTSSDPAIYVDGQRTNNTCILDMVDALNLERVEIYPSGLPRAGYMSDPYGVILIFMRSS